MAINRVLSAIWAQLSAHGSLIKTATNPYHPNPGAETDGANNQGLAAITGGSPFLALDRNGHSPEVPVATNLVDGANLSPSEMLDENSGAYHVTRQYGDIYLYNDGNVVAWGGNGKNFGFGNGYEENHAWANQPAVYNNETFQIPNGAMSSFVDADTYMLPSIPPDPEWEWQGGNVSKSWGNDYSYSYGSSYEWSAGPTKYVDAFGNTGSDLRDVMQGNHCTFSYGTGYEEALIEWRSGNTWFHADDSNSPYANRTQDNWASSNLTAWTGSNSATSWTASNLLVSKAFGPTYDYHYGPTLSIQEGASEERVNGPSWSTVIGDSTETVTGNSTSNVTGNSNETVTGNSTSSVTGNSDETVHGDATSHTYGHNQETHWGLSDEYFMGGKNEMMLAGCDEINLAAKMELVGGIAAEIFLGAKLEFFAGFKAEIASAPVYEAKPLEFATTAGASIKAGAIAIKTNVMALFA